MKKCLVAATVIVLAMVGTSYAGMTAEEGQDMFDAVLLLMLCSWTVGVMIGMAIKIINRS